MDFNIGLDYRNTTYGDPGVIRRFDPNANLIEIRDDADHATGHDIGGYMNVSTWLGKNFVQLNGKVIDMPRVLVTTSTLL